MKASVSPIGLSLGLSLALGLAASGSAHQVVVGKLKIGHPWVHEAPEGAPGTYSCIIEIHNDGDEPERLLGATIDGAGKGVLYKLAEADGHFTSQPLDEGLVIPAHGGIELPPDKYQFKFGKIAKALEADAMVEGTLEFEKLGSAPVEFMIEQDDTAPKEDAPDLARLQSTIRDAVAAAASHVDERIADLKTKLKIAEAQLPQWSGFAEALRAAAKTAEPTPEAPKAPVAKPAPVYPGARSYPDAAAIKKTGPALDSGAAMGASAQAGDSNGLPEKYEEHEKRLAERLAALKAIKAALAPLYASFSDEQKKIADGLIIGPVGLI